MARIRTIKPEFYRHEELQQMEIDMPGQYPMMVFSALWGHCDKNGVFEWKPRQLQLDIIPFIWEATGKHLRSTLEALVNQKFIKTYTDGQKVYGFIPTFKEHQRINGKEAQAPAQFPEIEQMQVFTISEAIGKHLRSNREATETTGREGKGREGKGNLKSQEQKTKSPPRSAPLIELPDFVSEDAWFGFIEMRKKIKKPATERAMIMLIKKLTMFHNGGHDVNAILDQSTVNSWQDLYELKNTGSGYTNGNGRTSGSTSQIGKKAGIVEANRAGTDFLS